MKLVTAVRSLGPIDARSVGRDAMLRWMIFLPLVITAAIRFLLPALVEGLEQYVPLDLQALYSPFMGYMFLALIPYLWGMVIGFLLLDERDDQTLTALQVTPLPTSHYLFYRLAAPCILSALATLLLFPLTGVAEVRAGALVGLAIGAAPLAPLVALLLAAFAANKVQGLAMAKASGLFLLPPLVAAFLPAPWAWLAAVAPTFWTAQAFWQTLENGSLFWFYVAGGLLYQLVLLLYLSRRFERIMHR